MEQLEGDAERWLDREDRSCRHDRLARLTWLASLLPKAVYLTFPGGWMSKQLYEEAQYSFVYAQFLAATVLGFAFVEHTLAAMFFAAGRDDLEKAPPVRLFHEAVALGWLSADDHNWLERARKLRNPVTHFRAPGAEDTIEYRSVTGQERHYAVLESDARYVIAAAMRLVTRGAV